MIIFLVGMPGVGKSFWLKKLKKHLNCEGTDLDLAIEIKTQLRISEIFQTHGAHYFRTLEAKVLRQSSEQVAAQKFHVISTGGGTPCFFENMDFMLANGLVVYLKSSPKFIKSRLDQAKVGRPLIDAVPESERLEFITKMLAERSLFYERSHIVFDALKLTISTFANTLQDYQSNLNS